MLYQIQIEFHAQDMVFAENILFSHFILLISDKYDSRSINSYIDRIVFGFQSFELAIDFVKMVKDILKFLIVLIKLAVDCFELWLDHLAVEFSQRIENILFCYFCHYGLLNGSHES